MLALIAEPAQIAIVENRAAGTAVLSTITAGKDHRQSMFGNQQLFRLRVQLSSLGVHLHVLFILPVGSRWVLNQLGKIFVVVAFKQRFLDGFDLAHLTE